MADIEKKAMLVPYDNLDKVVLTTRSSIGKADSIGIVGLTVNIVPYKLLPKAIYSYDGGVTWYDTADYIVSNQTPDIAINVTSQTGGGLKLDINQKALVNGGSQVDIIMRFALLAPPGTDLIDTANIFFTGVNAYRDTNKYLEILKEGSFQVSSGSTTQTPIAHGLGDYPFVEVFMDDPNAGSPGICLMRNTFGLPGSPADAIRVDTQNLYINTAVHGGAPTLTIYYKIYKEI